MNAERKWAADVLCLVKLHQYDESCVMAIVRAQVEADRQSPDVEILRRKWMI